MNGYEVKISYASKELTARERIAFKDTTDVVKLDAATENGAVEIFPAAFAVLDIHNEHAKGKNASKDYKNYIIVDMDGTRYCTGSEAFFTAFENIWDEMVDAGEEPGWGIKVYRKDSKNYEGKSFITCSIL